eukprot:7659365-Alexandrium_andersonii.AAC.1
MQPQPRTRLAGAVPGAARKSTSTVSDTPAWLDGASKEPARRVLRTAGISSTAAFWSRTAKRTSSLDSQGNAGSDCNSNAACKLLLTATLPSGLNPRRAMKPLARKQTMYANTRLTAIGTPDARKPRT